MAEKEQRMPSIRQMTTEPFVILPEQMIFGHSSSTPEKKLYIAILQDAIDEYMRNCIPETVRQRNLFSREEEWFEDDDRDFFCSFINICHILNLDPDYIRRGLRRYRETKIASEIHATTDKRKKPRKKNK
jgi:hypothetical protein